jgi:hypothetical protein
VIETLFIALDNIFFAAKSVFTVAGKTVGAALTAASFLWKMAKSLVLF